MRLPRSLFGRNVLLILVLIAFGQLTGALLFWQFVQRPRIEQLAAVAIRQVKSIQAVLLSVEPAQRAVLIDRMNAAQLPNGPSVRIAGELPANRFSTARRDVFVAQFARLVARQLQASDDDLRWIVEHDGSLWAPLQVAQSEYWVGIQGVRLESNLLPTWLGVSLLSTALAIGGALLIQRRINQPLQTLVAAATQIARGDTPQKLDENAPTEIATVSQAFNRMTASLARSDEERVVMLAGVSHDLRTPLTKMRLGLEILRGRGEPEVIEAMLRSAEEMDGIIDQFLDYARGGSAEPATIADLNDIVSRCVARYALRGQPLTADCDNVPPLPLRVRAIERVLTNLVENALRYGKPEIRIATRCSNGMVSLGVSDQGPGVAPAELAAMKKPFVRGTAARSGPPGAGLGLTIVERIAQAHGGNFALLARASGGLEARIELPLQADSVQAQPADTAQ